MLYVGLGGTGLQIGTVLEQRLRTELCGPDGLELTKHPQLAQLDKFELPPFLQFLYADYDENARNASMAAGRQYTEAADNNATYLMDMTPPANSSAAVSEVLRTDVTAAVRGWLPGPKGEPQVSPLTLGAGQFPTVGRAALFERFRASGGLGPVRSHLLDSFRQISRSRDKLQALLDYQPRHGCDIFVGFSVAGGTGTGIFWDFLRLIAAAAQETFNSEGGDQADVKIYPVVVLPSAIDFDKKGGHAARTRRAADLNGGPALKDLFEMIDNCNSGLPNREAIYPGEQSTRIGEMVPVQTAFLFRRPQAIQMEDLHRSIVTFILSLVGTELKMDTGTRSGSFASEFLNGAEHRNRPAPDGIGLHPASTALAAQLTIPITEIAEILAGRLVAEATNELRNPLPSENNREPVKSFIAAAGLSSLQDRAFDDALPAVQHEAKGASAVFGGLNEHRAVAVSHHRQLQQALKSRATALATNFNWGPAVRNAASQYDLFRVHRVALGVPISGDENTKNGFVGFVQQRGRPLAPPAPHFGAEPPVPPQLSDKFLGLRRVKFADPAPRAALQEIHDWYTWRTQAEWHVAWADNNPIWVPKLRSLKARLDDIIESFNDYAKDEPELFRESCAKLYAPRTGVVYFLPDPGQGDDLDAFYRTTLLPILRESSQLPEQAEAAQIVGTLMLGKWEAAYEQTQTAGSHQALRYVMDLVKEHIYAALANEMPRLNGLLRAAASGQTEQQYPVELIKRFQAALTALLPSGAHPGGRGDSPLDVRVFYPADVTNPVVEGYLKEQLFQGKGTQSYHPIADANFMGVVMTRTELPATGIGDFRQLMRTWGEAMDHPQEGDALAWRQRLGYESRWIVLSAEDRQKVTLSLLNALWDGSVKVIAGTDENPEKIRISQYSAPDAPPIELELKPYGKLSSWSTFLRVYERFVLSDNDTVTMRCEQFVSRHTPEGAADGPAPPDPLYEKFIAMIPDQAALARDLYVNAPEAGRGRAEQVNEFWNETLPATRAREFGHDSSPMGRNHLELYANMKPGTVNP